MGTSLEGRFHNEALKSTWTIKHLSPYDIVLMHKYGIFEAFIDAVWGEVRSSCLEKVGTKGVSRSPATEV
ncbi:hypothetical protein M407DRAFT_243314, partial [Tulasnella calospora MUT 4182]